MAQVLKAPNLEEVIDSVTKDLERKALNARLKKLAKVTLTNAATICEHILAEQTERNIKASTIEGKIKVLVWVSEYLHNKSFETMTKQDLLNYLNHLKKSPSDDPDQKWIGTYNGRVMILSKFFRWLYNKDEPDVKKRTPPPCIQGIKQLPRQGESYKPEDMWSDREHEVFLRWCPSARDRCYHSMANDVSARPHELLNLKIKDIVMKVTEEGAHYAQILARGKTRPRTLVLHECLDDLKKWLLQHPTSSNPESWLFISESHQTYGKKLKRDSLLAKYQYRYKAEYFPKLLEDDTVPDADKAVIKNLLLKPWNLYVFRHSALTEKSQVLTESLFKDHAGWTMKSKRPATYVHYFGNESARKLLELKGIVKPRTGPQTPKVKSCSNCKSPNKPEAKICVGCRMFLTIESVKESEDRIKALQNEIAEMKKKQKAVEEEMIQRIWERLKKEIKKKE